MAAETSAPGSKPASLTSMGTAPLKRLPLDIFEPEAVQRINYFRENLADTRQKKNLARVLDIAGERAESTMAGATAESSSKKALRQAERERKLEEIHLADKKLYKTTYQQEFEGGAGVAGEALQAKVDHFRLMQPYLEGLVRPERMPEVEEWVRHVATDTRLVDRRKLLFEALVSLNTMDEKHQTEHAREYHRKPIPPREPPPTFSAHAASSPTRAKEKKQKGTTLPPLARSAPEPLVRAALEAGAGGHEQERAGRRERAPFVGVVPGGATESTYKASFVPRMARGLAPPEPTNWHRLPSDGMGTLVPQTGFGGSPSKAMYDSRQYHPRLPADRAAALRASTDFQYPWPLSTAHGSYQPAASDDPVLKSYKSGAERAESLKRRARGSEVPLSIGVGFRKDTTYTNAYDGARLAASAVAPF
eukprot:tig00000900_g5381.t1